MRLHCFNPWHDEALAEATPHYVPSLAARRMAADLALLPLWWADAGDAVAVLSPTNATSVFSVATIDRTDVAMADASTALRHAAVPDAVRGCTSVDPWGWDALLVRSLRDSGVAPSLLPDAGRLSAIRAASSRLTAVRLLAALRDVDSRFVGSSVWCADEGAVRRAVEARPHTLLKAPWSGSGRGLRQGFGRLDDALAGWVRRVLSRQGGLSVEPFLPKRCDFALEFEARPDGRLDCRGPSLFTTDATGRYTGSLVAADATVRLSLSRHVDLRLVDRACRLIGRALPPLLGGYTGPLGVDMMAVETDGGGAALHPCVEVNLRRTMGRVALDLRRWLAPGRQGRFVLCRPRRSPSRPIMAGGRLAGGSLRLTPVGPETDVAAYIDMEC